MSTETIGISEAFDYVNLSEVDPNAKAITEDFYRVRVTGAAAKPFTAKSGPKQGEPGVRYEFKVQVTEDGPARGRVIFDSLFHGEGALRAMRRLMDASGIPQEDGEPISEYLPRLAKEAPEVRYKITVKKENDRDGNPVDKNRIDFYSASVA
jgi:hypothetical protein